VVVTNEIINPFSQGSDSMAVAGRMNDAVTCLILMTDFIAKVRSFGLLVYHWPRGCTGCLSATAGR
jgi:hypothetical protein